MKVLQVIEAAYRGTIEEQDDTIVWLTHALHGAGASLDLVMRGAAVQYAVRGQDAAGLAFGAIRQTQPPRIADDVRGLIDKGVTVFVVEEDLRERGIEVDELIDGVEIVSLAAVANLFERYDRVWHW